MWWCCTIWSIVSKTQLEALLKMHNIKHDQKACRWREAVTIEHPHNPFSVFQNYNSLLCGALHSLTVPDLVTKNNTKCWSCYGHHTVSCSLLTIIRPAICWIIPPFFYISRVLKQSSRSKDMQSYHHIILDCLNKILMCSCYAFGFWGTGKLLSMKITSSYFKWMQIGNSESCRMAT